MTLRLRSRTDATQWRPYLIQPGRADRPRSAAVERGRSTLPKAEAFQIRARDLNLPTGAATWNVPFTFAPRSARSADPT